MPINMPMVADATRNQPSPYRTTHDTVDNDVQVVVWHDWCTISEEGVVSLDAKLRPEIVTHVPPVARAFFGSETETTGESNVRVSTLVPISFAIVIKGDLLPTNPPVSYAYGVAHLTSVDEVHVVEEQT